MVVCWFVVGVWIMIGMLVLRDSGLLVVWMSIGLCDVFGSVR